MTSKTYPPLADFVDLLLDAVCVVDQDGHYIHVNAAFERIFGYKPEEIIGRNMIELVAPEYRERTLQNVRNIMSGQPVFDYENQYVRKDGQRVDIMWTAQWSPAHQVRIAVAHDITNRKRAERMQDAVYAISEAAHAAEDLYGLLRQIHQIISRLLPAEHFSVAIRDEFSSALSFPYHAGKAGHTAIFDNEAARACCAEVMESGQPMLRADEAPDGRVACWLGAPLKTPNGTIGALVMKSMPGGTRYSEQDTGLLQFVSAQIATVIERQRLYARLQHMAQHDGLTGLPNREFLYDRLNMAIARANRSQSRVALLYVDLDHFKAVNDTYGHAIGDGLLRQVAERLKRCVRESDTVARIGGDEFVLLLENVELTGAVMVAEKIRQALAVAIMVEDLRLIMRPSIGTAVYPDDATQSRVLLKVADDAMYRDKKKHATTVLREIAGARPTD